MCLIGLMPPETITHVAIKFADGRIVALPKPCRHGDIVMKIGQDIHWKPGDLPICGTGDVQGFLTSTERFVDRVEGLQLAIAAGQILPTVRMGSQLYSENLW